MRASETVNCRTDRNNRHRKLNKGEAEPVDFSNEEELMARVQAEIDTNLNTPDAVQIIPRTIIAPYITEIVQKSMPKEEFDKMCADPLHYRLCFLDGAFGCLRIDDETEFVQQIVFMPERMDLIPCAEVATKLHYAFKNSGDFRTEAAAAAFKGLAAIAYMRNAEIELLKEINWEMTGMGLWNVSDDTVTVGVQKYLFGSGILPNYAMADCNDDGRIYSLDISCIKRILIA